MLTKETAIARLRATGTLGASVPDTHIIAADAAKQELVRIVNKVLMSNTGTRGMRMVAPGCNQSVLP